MQHRVKVLSITHSITVFAEIDLYLIFENLKQDKG